VLWQLTATLLTATLPTTTAPTTLPAKVDPTLVTPGVWGFVITAGIMIVAVLLIIDMVRRIRRVNYRAEVRQRLDAEAAEASGPAATTARPAKTAD